MKYKINEKISLENIGVNENDDFIVYNNSKDDILVVNNTTAEVLLLIKKHENISFDQIVDILLSKYIIEKGRLLNDLDNILKIMINKDVIIAKNQ